MPIRAVVALEQVPALIMSQESLISRALSTPIDYSQSFVRRMKELRDALEKDLGLPVRLKTDMNYSAAHKLIVPGLLRDKHGNLSEIVYLVSSRGPLFTSYCLERVSRNEWQLVPEDELPTHIRETMRKIDALLEKHELLGVYGEVLESEAQGHLTEMDEAPATVFQALFSELI